MRNVWILGLTLLLGGASYQQEIASWRAQEEALLRSENGWLTLAGLFWLKEGRNEPDFPAGTPSFGTFELTQGKVLLHSAGGGRPSELTPDRSGNSTVVKRGSWSVQVIRRGQRVGVRLRNSQSSARRDFRGMIWYPVDSHYRTAARWEAYEPVRKISITNILGDELEESCPGRAVFELEGRTLSLEPIVAEKKLHFIFRDLTSGKETYGGGRFLYTDPPQNGTLVLDFNKAVNPPCAFTELATCPLPPRQNHLAARLPAGEKKPAYP